MTYSFSRLGGVLAGVLGLLACTQKPPSDEEIARQIDRVAPPPTEAMAASIGEPLDHIGMGYALFQRKCLECHEPRVPTDPDAANWHPIMEGMAWNAGLSESEESAVLDYLHAATRATR